MRPAFWLFGLVASIAAPATAAPVQWVSGGGNGHFYEFVASTDDWHAADAAVQGMSYNGEQGYLASIHSAAENTFVFRLLQSQGFPFLAAAWLGGYQTPPMPEVSPASDWHWTSGEAFDFTYWYTGSSEPNNLYGGEDYMQMYNYGNGGWNDCTATCYNNKVGYLVEYAGTVPSNVIPEPAIWTAFVIGFGLVGTTIRRRRQIAGLASA